MTRTIQAFAAAIAVAAACAPAPEPADTVPSTGMVAGSQSGTVQMVGSAPVNTQLVLQPSSGPSIRLTGERTAELERLQGAAVTVWGTVAASGDPIVSREIEVEAYRIDAIDGRPVVMGEIIQMDGNAGLMRTAEGELVELEGLPADFRVGQLVWVQGPTRVVVQSYGTVRP